LLLPIGQSITQEPVELSLQPHSIITKNSSLVRKAKLQAGIKPTALCSAIDKKNLVEFLLDFLYYLYNYYMICVLLSHAYHVIHYVTLCDVML